MSARGLVHNDTFIFDGTNYDAWKISMHNIFEDMGPNIDQIVADSILEKFVCWTHQSKHTC